MKTLARRTVLRGIGGTAIALPLLEAMMSKKAQAAPPRRLILFMSPNGTLHDKWVPTIDAARNITAMSPMLAPLDPYKKKLLMLTGIDMQSADADKGDLDEGHMKPKRHMLTAKLSIVTPGSSYGAVGGISIDQEIAKQVGGATKFRSIELGVQGGEMSSLGPKTYAKAITDPKAAFTRFFTGVTPGQPTVDPALVRLQKRRQSILDYVKPDYDRLKLKVGVSDGRRIDTHLTSIREMERSWAVAVPTVSAGCTPPNVSGAPNGSANGDFMKIGYAHMDLLAAAIACDLTRVASLEWAGSGIYAPFLGSTFNTDHHQLSHDNQAAIQTIQTWYATHFAYLLNKLDGMAEGGGTVLDNTAAVWLSDISHGYHTRWDIPYVIAGSAGGYFKTGRHVDLNPTGDHEACNCTHRLTGVAHNNLFLTFMEMMGIQGATTFGDAQFCKGPLALG